MILELNLNESTIVTYSPEPEYEEFESTEIIIPINNNIKLVISGVKGSNNECSFKIPPMAKFIDLADDEDEELEETIKISCDNLVLCETNFIVKNNIKNLLNNYI